MREKKRLLRALDGLPLDRPPFWFMRQAGRFLPEYRQVREECGDFLSLCYTPEKACEVTLQPLRRFGMDAAILFSDILVIPDALGIPVSFVKGEGPKLEALDTPEKLFSLKPCSMETPLAPVYDAVDRIRSAMEPEQTLIGFSGAPWTLATYIVEGGSSRDFTKTRSLAIRSPEAFQHLMDILVQAVVEHLILQVDAGAEVVQLFDSWCSILPEGEFEKWCIAPIRDIISLFKEQCPGVPVIVFPKGAGLRYATFALETGADAVSMDMCVPMDAMQMVAETVTVQGNLDPLLLAYNKEGMLQEAEKLLQGMRKHSFIFNLGHGIVPETPIAHVEALSRLIREWRN